MSNQTHSSGPNGPVIYIGDRPVGPGYPVYFIAEIGINHNGNPEMARKLIDIAADAGADAVKFQKRNLNKVYPPDLLLPGASTHKEVEYVLDYLVKFELSDEVFVELAEYARSKGLEFLCSPWDKESVDFLEEIGVPAYKIASADMTNFPLLEYVARTGKPLIVSTGMSDWREIERTVEFLRGLGAEFALLHCQSTYPAAFKDVNLRVMLRLMQFGVPVGYSGHERGIAVSTAAAALGACIIERHITLDRTLPGPDHAASLEPPGLRKQIRDIRIIQVALGTDRRSPSRGELLTRLALGKSLAAARDIRKGETITWDCLTALSPGDGINPQRALEIIGRPAPRDFKAGEFFREADITGREPAAAAASLPIEWGIVVRFRDAAAMIGQLKPPLVEFHLNDRDLDEADALLAGLPQFSGIRLAVHCPEYYHGKLLDLCAPDEELRRWSVDIVRRAAELARRLHEKFPDSPEPFLVVHPGAASFDGFVEDRGPLAEAFAKSVADLLPLPGVAALFENLPPYPWYFGGQWYGNYFCDAAEIAEACQRLGIRICLDVSHAQLWCAHAGASLADFIGTVRPFADYLHVADATGVDGEGIQIGEGDIDWPAILPLLLELNVPMLAEIWLGHSHGGQGFAVALSRLAEMMQATGAADARGGR